jgi:hypothetical protein
MVDMSVGVFTLILVGMVIVGVVLGWIIKTALEYRPPPQIPPAEYYDPPQARQDNRTMWD